MVVCVAGEPAEDMAEHVICHGCPESMRPATRGGGPSSDRCFSLVVEGPDEGHRGGIPVPQLALESGAVIGRSRAGGEAHDRAARRRNEAGAPIQGNGEFAVGAGVEAWGRVLGNAGGVGLDADLVGVFVEFDQPEEPVAAVWQDLVVVGDHLQDFEAGSVGLHLVGGLAGVSAEHHEDLRIVLHELVEDLQLAVAPGAGCVGIVGRTKGGALEHVGRDDGWHAGIGVDDSLSPSDGVEGRHVSWVRSRAGRMAGHVILKVEHEILPRSASGRRADDVPGVEVVGADSFVFRLTGVAMGSTGTAEVGPVVVSPGPGRISARLATIFLVVAVSDVPSNAGAAVGISSGVERRHGGFG